MSSAQVREQARGNAIGTKLAALNDAVEAWARGSTDGGRVWEVAGELLPAIWSNWHIAYSSLAFPAAIAKVDRDLADIAIHCDDQAVNVTVAATREAIALYRDPQ